MLLKPAPEGTGVIAGGAVRAVMTSAGVQNVLTKSLGTANPHNVIKATFDALVQLRDRNEVAAMRGKTVQEIQPWQSEEGNEGRGKPAPEKAAAKASAGKVRGEGDDSDSVFPVEDSGAGETQTGDQGLGLHAAEPDCGAGRYAVDSGNGEDGAASGEDCWVRQVQ